MPTNNPKKYPKLTTPRGVFKWPRLAEADYGNDKFPKPNGEFKVTLVLAGDAAQQLIRKIRPFYDEALDQGKAEYAKLPVKTRKSKALAINDFYSPVYDEETEEETGAYEFKFSMTASGVNKKTGKKWERKPALFDAKGKPLPKSISPWGGSEGKVSFSMNPYFIPGTCMVGLKLMLEAAQIIELVSGGQKDAKGYGFGEEEGFEADEEFGDESSEDETKAEEEGDGDF